MKIAGLDALCPTDPTRFQAKSGPPNSAVRDYSVLPEQASYRVTPPSTPCHLRRFPTRPTQPTPKARSAGGVMWVSIALRRRYS